VRPLVASPEGDAISILDQTLLPHREAWLRLQSLDAVAEAIRAMRVRGAPLIGVTAAYGLSLALRDDPSDQELDRAVRVLTATRPTALNLGWALTRVAAAARAAAPPERALRAFQEAETIALEDVAACRAIGDHGLPLLRGLQRAVGGSRPVQVLTHCNAGWLAALEYGTALAPVYRAHEEGLPVHVWVDETRPRNQGWLTAWELGRAGVPHTVVTDNASGHLLQRGEVDIVLVGADRVARNGDVCNKVGTWLKALAADEAGVPFHVAAPGSSIDWGRADGRSIPIEERGPEEVTDSRGIGAGGEPVTVRLAPPGTPVRNLAFDVTPARYITSLITERGVGPASEAGLVGLFPERVGNHL
jgi:methylthioribose-1-phosphate isomerase